MKIIKQQPELSVRNNVTDAEDRQNKQKHGSLLPSSIRCIICGPSNCGKTNVMYTLICNPNGLRFENVYVYSKSLHQAKYQMLEKAIGSIKGMGYYPFEDNVEVVQPAQAKRNSIFIFDDVACDKQDNMRCYFSMGRHNDIDCFYLCQSYTRIPKHLIRDNANMLVLFKQDDLNLKHVYNDHVNTDMAFEIFKKLCSECWNDKYGFLVISKDNEINKGRYRRGFDGYIYIS